MSRTWLKYCWLLLESSIFTTFSFMNFFPADVSGLDRNERFRKHVPVKPLSCFISNAASGMCELGGLQRQCVPQNTRKDRCWMRGFDLIPLQSGQYNNLIENEEAMAHA